MEKDELDSGLMSIFRLFEGLRVVAGVLALTASFALASTRFRRTEIATWMGSIEALLLLGYLSWPWLRRKLGKAYLPIALIVAILGPLVENYLAVIVEPVNEVALVRALAGQWQTIFMLLVPIILITWKYGYRAAAGASLGMALIDGLFLFNANNLQFEDARPFPLLGVIIFRTITFLVISYVITRLSSELLKRNARLEQANRQLSTYASTLERLTVSRERNRLARELHDTLAHSLSALAVQLEAVDVLWESDPQQARGMLEHSLQITRNGLNEARGAIQTLRTAPLEDLGLALALRNLAATTADRAGLLLQMDVSEELPALAPEVEYAVFRITEEGLRNIVEHAGPCQVTLSLHREGAGVKLELRDDGCGFDPQSIPSEDRYGLRGMQERAEAMGGAFKVESKPGTGTCIQVAIGAY